MYLCQIDQPDKVEDLKEIICENWTNWNAPEVLLCSLQEQEHKWLCSQSLKGQVLFPLYHHLKDWLSLHSEHNIPSCWIQQPNQLQFWQAELKNQNNHVSYFQWLSLPCRNTSKSFSICTSSQQTSSQQRIICPTDFHTPISDCSAVQLWGRKDEAMSAIRAAEWAQSTGRNAPTAVSRWQSRGHCPHGHGGARDHSWKPEWAGKHLVPTSAVPSGFQWGDWR